MLFELRPRSHRNYAGLPVLGPILDEFTDWSHECGFAIGTIRNQLKDARQIVPFLQAKQVSGIDQLGHEQLDQAWEHFRLSRPSIAGTVRRIQRFVAERQMISPPSSPQKTRTDEELAELGTYLKNTRGMEESTIGSHLRYLRRFLDAISFDTNEAALCELSVDQIDRFLNECAKTVNRYSLQHVVAYLRSFLRFEHTKGRIPKPLHQMIDTPRVYRLEKLPKAVDWETVQRLLASIDRSEPHGLRNYAMLFLTAAYGLRCCEIVSLTLDDIDWRSRQIQIAQPKTGNDLVLPLIDSVANVLIEYLKNARPSLRCREIFLRVRAPHGTLKPTAVSEAFQRQVRLSGLDIPHQGAHCLRHSYATHLLREGTSVKVIGDLLGHRNAESTCVYLRLATEDLRSVALDVPPCDDPLPPLDDTALRQRPRLRSRRRVNFSTSFESPLADDIVGYLAHHRALGKGYRIEHDVLLSLDAFVADHHAEDNDLNGKIFAEWCDTFSVLSANVKRNRMRIVRNFCLYRLRSYPQCFVPDILTFPAARPHEPPHILSPEEIGRIIALAHRLPSSPTTPLRSQVVRLGFVLLFTCGLRRGELLRLTLADYNADESTLFIRSTKFHKDRLVPLSLSADAELRTYLNVRQQHGLPMDQAAPIMLSRADRTKVRAYSGTGLARNWRILCASLMILTPQHAPPRLHDIRHSFAVNALLRWYHNGENVQAKLPQFSTYMGHVSVASTQCYLNFVAPLRAAANLRFEQNYSNLIPDEIEAPQFKVNNHQQREEIR